MDITFFGSLAIPLWLVTWIIAVIALLLVFWIWAIVHCLTSELTGAQKLFWVIIIVILNVLGALIYLIFTKVGGITMAKSKFKGKRLMRSKKNKVIAGVCGGIGEYLNIDPTLVRIMWIVFSLMGGAGILAYIIAWIIMPERK
jgi:phage shock protein PspC (stress-responsive transcriptional regulator)